MGELYWISQALGSIQAHQNRIKENQELILERLEEFKTKLEDLGKRVDEQVLVDFRAGMLHLLAGYNSDVDDVRTEEFRMARSIFGKLMSLNPAERTTGTSGEIENPDALSPIYVPRRVCGNPQLQTQLLVQPGIIHRACHQNIDTGQFCCACCIGI